MEMENIVFKRTKTLW